MMLSLSLATAVLVIQGPSSTLPRRREALPVERLPAPISFDGRIGDAAWQAIPSLPVTTYQPVFGQVPSERTEFRIAYDDRYIYIAAAMFDSHAGRIRRTSWQRDEDNGGDFVTVALDTFNDDQSAVTFTTTPTGNRIDLLISNDAEGPGAINRSYDGRWDVVTSVDEHGWYAEFRIAFSTLRFTSRGGRAVMGLVINRLIGRNNERIIFPAIEPRWMLGRFKPSQAQDVVFEGIEPRRAIYLVPYGTGGIRRTEGLATLPDPVATSLEGNLGGDAKVALSPNVALDLTANTDFAEVEADRQQVNLTRFSIFFPEKRQFFLERSGVFDFFTGKNDLLFHSRRIGLGEGGERRTIYGGFRLVGRQGSWDFGLMSLQTEGAPGEPSQNQAVWRVKRQMADRRSYLGAMLTGELGGGRQGEVTAGIDGSLNLGGEHYLTLAGAHMFGARLELPTGSWTDGATAGRILVERRGIIGLGWRAAAALVEPGYAPALGFVERPNAVRLETGLSYGIMTTGAGSLRMVTPNVSAYRIASAEEGDLQSARLQAGAKLEQRSGALLSLDGYWQREVLDRPFGLGDGVAVPAGNYRFGRIGLSYTGGPGWRLIPRLSGEVGSFYDGTLESVRVGGDFALSSRVRISTDLVYDRASFPERAALLETLIGRLRLNVAANARFSATAVAEYGSLPNVVIGNLRFRYNFREGHDLWLVYDHVVNVDRDRLDPILPRNPEARVLVKYSRSFLL
jgi:hypothetical protein